MTNKKIKILAVTGIRSDYDLMQPVYNALLLKKNIELSFFVTGAHLSRKHGFTVDQIIRDKFKISKKSKSLIISNTLGSRVLGMTKQLKDLVKTINLIKPNIILVLGDREEAMSAAIAGSYMNIPIAHVAGGDRVIGNIDDQIRHAVTKLSHIHFTTSNESKKRILKMGEQSFRVFNVGNPGIDRLIKVKKISSSKLSKVINFDIDYNEKYLMLIQHPLSSEYLKSYDQMITTLKTIEELKIKTIVIYPNSDVGSQEIIKAIKEFDHLDFIYSIENLERDIFVNLLRNCNCLIGNSSAGIIEAPFLKLPVVNIGNRQKKRLHSTNVQFVEHNIKNIKKAIKRSIFDKKYITKVKKCKNPYGNGTAASKIANVLSQLKIEPKLLIKDITY